MTQSRLLKVWIAIVAIASIAMLAAPAMSPAADSDGATSTEQSSSEEHGKPKPIDEFKVDRIGPKLMVGPIDMSLNKAVIYLLIAGFLCVGWAVWISRRLQLRPNRKQTFTEMFYEFSLDQIAKATLGPKVFGRYMPYVACLFVFLWTVNIISFIPLPISAEKVTVFGTEIPAFGLYAATSNLNVTLALTLVTFFASHYEGIRLNGPIKYFGSWAPPGPFALKAFVWPLHALSELLRLVSLSVRLFANMLAGHLLILMMISLILIIGTVAGQTTLLIVGVMGATMLGGALLARAKGKKALAGVLWVVLSLWIAVLVLGWIFNGVPTIAFGSPLIALFFFLFEFALIASLQASIFAMLSGIYIGFAAEPQH